MEFASPSPSLPSYGHQRRFGKLRWQELKTRKHPCSLEATSWGALLCGLYELSEDDSYRDGALEVYLPHSLRSSMRKDEEESCISSSLSLEHSLPFPSGGVLDMKLSGSESLLAVALSSETLSLCQISPERENCPKQKFEVSFPGEGLVLSASWDDTLYWPTTNPNLAVSTQSSSIVVLAMRESCAEEICAVHDAHVLLGESVPAWITCFDVHSKHKLLSGGDDMTLRQWDTRAFTAPTASNKRSHTAGVTALQWHPSKEHVFCSGSYDESVRVWDARNMSLPVKEVPTGGGVWRVKWTRGGSRIIAASMHAGCSVITLARSTEDVQGTGEALLGGGFQESEVGLHTFIVEGSEDSTLVYGVDVCAGPAGGQENGGGEVESNLAIASCSFYENKIHVYDVDLSF